jgi:DNA-binding CsgD family transcriptional regulator
VRAPAHRRETALGADDGDDLSGKHPTSSANDAARCEGNQTSGCALLSLRPMQAPCVRLDPSRADVAAFVSDDLALAVWEMLRRFRRATPIAELAKACDLPLARVQAVIDAALDLELVRRIPAGKGEPRVRYEVTGDRILLEVDPSSAPVRALLAACYRRFADESRQCIEESMADAARGRKGVPAMASITHLTLDDAEARELIALFKPIDAFVARIAEKHDRDPVGSPRRCNYHLALHVAPVSLERLPPARMTFAEKGKADELESDLAKRSSRLLSPRERTVANMLARGSTINAVANELGVSSSTVSTLCERIYRKLGVKRRAELVVKLHALGEG